MFSWLCLALLERIAAGADQYGRVTFSGQPVPGATLTATRGEVAHVTVTDAQGVFRFADLNDGPWALQVEMLGFSTVREDIVVSSGAQPLSFALTLLPFDRIVASGAQRSEAPKPPEPVQPAASVQAPAGGFQRAAVSVPSAPLDTAVIAGSNADGDRSNDAADGFLINGSVNNSAASPFAQLAAFGNNRRNARSLYNGGLGILLGNSAWAAAPYSFTDRASPKPQYNDLQIVGSFAGPVKVPGLRNRVNIFAGYQHTADHNATTQSVLIPTAAERRGDFSRSAAALGRPVRLVDPATGSPFPGTVIPEARISPQAAALLGFYPAPNVDAGGRSNYETPVLATNHQDAVQLRFVETLNTKTQVTGNVSLQRTNTDSANVFGFVDANAVSGVDVPIAWTHRFSQFVSLRLRYQHTRLATNVTPFFANRENVAGNAGIGGVNEDPVNWGPPTLMFSSGIAGLASAQYASNHDRTHALGAETIWSHGRHTITAGGDARGRRLDLVSQQNARGAFTFTGASTGSDLGDFLLGLPHASAIAFGNADKFLRAASADGYIADDWRASPTFTANIAPPI